LVEEPDCESEDDYDEDDYYEDNDEESDDDTSVSVAGPGLESHLLRGFRWLFQRVEDNEDDDDEDDDEDDEYDIMQLQRGHGQFNEDHYEPISLQVVGDRMRQRDITFDDLVALIAFPHKDNAEDCAKYTHEKIKELQAKIQEILEGTFPTEEEEETTETTEDAAVLTAEDDTLLTAEDDTLLTAESAFINFTNITVNEPTGFGFDDFMTIFNGHNRSTPASLKVSELQTRIRKILEEEEDSSDDEEEVEFVGTTIIDLTADDVKDLTTDDILPSFQFFDLTDDE
jgi:hypothetical protein